MSMAGLGAVHAALRRARFLRRRRHGVGDLRAVGGRHRPADLPVDRRRSGSSRVVPIQLAVHVPAVAGMIIVALATTSTGRSTCWRSWPARATDHGTAGPGQVVRATARNVPAAHGLRLGVAGRRGGVHPRAAAGHHRRAAGRAQRRADPGHRAAGRRDVAAAHPAVDRAQSRPAGRTPPRAGPAILLPGVGGISAIFVLLGGIFGSFEVTTVAFTREAGRAAGRRAAARAVRGGLAHRRADLRGPRLRASWLRSS